MRLFAAVTPPDDVRVALDAALVELRGSGPDLRWVPADQWHVTVAFYGEVAEDRVGELTERLARVAHRRTPFTLGLNRTGAFGDRVLWAGITGDRPALRRLAAAAAAAGRRTGLTMEDRDYRPHLTLARARAGADASVCAGVALALPAWPVTEVVLIASHLGPAPRHEPVAVLPLGRG